MSDADCTPGREPRSVAARFISVFCILTFAVWFVPVTAASGMIPLIPCYHFSAQQVLSVDDEPLAICGAGNDLFVATSRCSVSHYFVTTDASTQYKFVGSFPSVAAVDQMAYSEKSM